MYAPILTVKALPFVTVAPGESAEARIALSLAVGYHVQANPASDRFLVPLQLRVASRGGVRPGCAVYPGGEPYFLKGASEPLRAYSGTFEIVLPLHVIEGARPGDYLLRGHLRYQACDDRACLVPSSIPIAFLVEVLTPVGEEVIVSPIAASLRLRIAAQF